MNDKPLLPFEWNPFHVVKQVLSESADSGGDKMILSGVLQRAEAKNQNGRVYPYNILLRESRKYEENFVKQNRALGELDHPESSVVNLKNVSHTVRKMWWEGKDLLGEVEILSTPSGNILKELIKCGITVGISSRGLGTVKKINEGTVEVEEDFELIAFDFVSNPSTIGAFMRPNTLNESVSPTNSIEDKWNNTDAIVKDILSKL